MLEQRQGDRFLMQDSLSAALRPLSMYVEGPESSNLRRVRDEEANVTIERARLRQENADEQAKTGEHIFRDVCPKSAVERLVQNGVPFQRGRSDYSHTQYAPRLCAEYLENVLKRLRTYSSYELALLDPEEEANILQSSWEVKREHGVVLDTWHSDDQGHQVEVDLFITEPTIVRAFWDYSEELWNRISPKNRAKDYVIWWLEQQLERLRKQMAEHAGE